MKLNINQQSMAIIIYARLNSKRLSKKVLQKIMSKPLLLLIIDRIKKNSKFKLPIIVATSKNKNDDIIENLCLEKKYDVFRGDEHDVLGRFYNTAKSKGLNYVIRCNADCPLIDYKILDKGQLNKNYVEKEVSDYMKQPNLEITIEINNGNKKFTCYTMDFTQNYISINSDYRS